jgi:hypothetical protein
VGVDYVAEKKLGAGVDNNRGHVEALKRYNRRFNDVTL